MIIIVEEKRVACLCADGPRVHHILYRMKLLVTHHVALWGSLLEEAQPEHEALHCNIFVSEDWALVNMHVKKFVAPTFPCINDQLSDILCLWSPRLR